MKIALVACAKSKLPHAAPASKLYSSPLFQGSLAHAQRWGAERIFILSAKHGLVPASRRLAPDELTLTGMGSSARREWAAMVLHQLAKATDLGKDRFLLLAGEAYAEFLRPLLAKVEEPLRGMAMGNRLRFLRHVEDHAAQPRRRKSACQVLHEATWKLPRHRVPFSAADMPSRGVYLLFEQAEFAHGGERIVRIGTHTGKRSHLADRLREHFVDSNKNRSIFRKNIGRVLLAEAGDPYLEVWEKDLTSRKNREAFGCLVKRRKEELLERRISRYLKSRMSFVVLPVGGERSKLTAVEQKLIGTVAQCEECGASPTWPGLQSPEPRVSSSGLWQSLHLKSPACTATEMRTLLRSCR